MLDCLRIVCRLRKALFQLWLNQWEIMKISLKSRERHRQRLDKPLFVLFKAPTQGRTLVLALQRLSFSRLTRPVQPCLNRGWIGPKEELRVESLYVTLDHGDDLHCCCQARGPRV